MVESRTMEGSVEARSRPSQMIVKNEEFAEISSYEQTRKERIKANLERMEKLGIVDLSLKLKSLTTPKRTRRTSLSSQKSLSSPPSSGPLRRSSRLNSVTPVSYSEAALSKKAGLLEGVDVWIEEGSKPEVYTEEHEKLLGNTERSWTLFVDGYGRDGKRIYDPVKGKTCHQCRQKTLGYRTQCSKCQMVQGQFCGDCLYMRYGEHVLEGLENSNWICPVCRGICNCSLCRHAKGWAPTGTLYRKISSLGYKSVAHYLIQTRRSESAVVEKLPAVNQVSAKRSLPFSHMEAPCKRSNHQINDSEPLMPQPEDTTQNKTMKTNQLLDSKEVASDDQAKRCLPFPDNKAKGEVGDHLGLLEPLSGGQIECSENPSVDCQTMKLIPISGSEAHLETLEFKSEIDGNVAPEDLTKRSMPISGSETHLETLEFKSETGGSIASEDLTKRSIPISGSEEQSEMIEAAGISTEVRDFGSVKPIMEGKKDSDGFDGEEEKHLQSTNGEHDNSNIETCQIFKHKHALAPELISDSIAASLKPGNQETNDYVGAELIRINEKTSDVKESLGNDSSDQQMQKKTQELHVKADQNADCTDVSERSPVLQKKFRGTDEKNPDSIGGRLRQRRRLSRGYDDEVPGANHPNSNTLQAFKNNASTKDPHINKKQSSTAKTTEDSIAGRLRSRQKPT